MMDFDEQLEESHFVFTERKCRVCGKVKELIDGLDISFKSHDEEWLKERKK